MRTNRIPRVTVDTVYQALLSPRSDWQFIPRTQALLSLLHDQQFTPRTQALLSLWLDQQFIPEYQALFPLWSDRLSLRHDWQFIYRGHTLLWLTVYTGNSSVSFPVTRLAVNTADLIFKSCLTLTWKTIRCFPHCDLLDTVSIILTSSLSLYTEDSGTESIRGREKTRDPRWP